MPCGGGPAPRDRPPSAASGAVHVRRPDFPVTYHLGRPGAESGGPLAVGRTAVIGVSPIHPPIRPDTRGPQHGSPETDKSGFAATVKAAVPSTPSRTHDHPAARHHGAPRARAASAGQRVAELLQGLAGPSPGLGAEIHGHGYLSERKRRAGRLAGRGASGSSVGPRCGVLLGGAIRKRAQSDTSLSGPPSVTSS
jgi:hypothetical protein